MNWLCVLKRSKAVVLALVNVGGEERPGQHRVIGRGGQEPARALAQEEAAQLDGLVPAVVEVVAGEEAPARARVGVDAAAEQDGGGRPSEDALVLRRTGRHQR